MDKKMYDSPVLHLYFDDPEGAYHIREIARQTKLHPNTVLKHVDALIKAGLLTKRTTRAIVEIRANRDSELFVDLKKIANLRAIYLSGIIDELHTAYAAPEAIILFGSSSKGEDTKKSDIDIAIITKRHLTLDLTTYENLLKRKIQIIETDPTTSSKQFITNLANGIILKGYLTL